MFYYFKIVYIFSRKKCLFVFFLSFFLSFFYALFLSIYLSITVNYVSLLFLFIFLANGLKEVEIEKCRRDIKEIKRELFASEKKVIDYNRIR